MILVPDATLTITGLDGRVVNVQRMPHMLARQQRVVPNAQMSRSLTPQANGNSVNANMHQQRAMAPMAPPPAVPQARVSSNGILRPPSTPAVPTLPTTPAPVSTPTPPQPLPCRRPLLILPVGSIPEKSRSAQKGREGPYSEPAFSTPQMTVHLLRGLIG